MVKKKSISFFIVFTIIVGLITLDGSQAGRIAFACAVGFAGLVVFFKIRRWSHMNAKNYDWYRQSYPNACRSDHVVCHKCQSHRIQAKNVMQQMYMREHFCGQCGETLYYSPEGMNRK